MARVTTYTITLLLAALSALAIERTNGLFRYQDELRSWAWIVLLGMSVGAILFQELLVRRRPRWGYSLLGGWLIGALLAAWIILPLVNTLSLPNFWRITLWSGSTLSLGCIASLLLWRLLNGLDAGEEHVATARSRRPIWVLDTCAIIDGRIADVIDTGVFGGTLLVPEFVLGELQAIADSSDKLRRQRGQRGLDVLRRLQANSRVLVQIESIALPGAAEKSVDLKLVQVAQQLGAKLVTVDGNLNQIAKLQGVEVININDVAHAGRSTVLSGESFEIALMKPGEEAGQAVGYLSDGTMVVVIDGQAKLQQTVRVIVNNVLQTSGGRMIFARLEN